MSASTAVAFTWQTYRLASLYKFPEVVQQDIFRRLRASPGCGSTKCSYDADEDVFEIICPADPGRRNLATLVNLVESFVSMHLDHAQISDHGTKLSQIKAAFVHTDSFPDTEALEDSLLQLLTAPVKQIEFLDSDQDVQALDQKFDIEMRWKPEFGLNSVASAKTLEDLERIGGCKLVVDTSTNTIVISGNNNQSIGETYSRLSILERSQHRQYRIEHILHLKTDSRYMLRAASLDKLTDGSLRRILVPTDSSQLQNKLDLKMLAKSRIVRLMLYEARTQQLVEAKRIVKAPSTRTHSIGTDIWSRFRFCAIGEEAPQVKIPQPSLFSRLLPELCDLESPEEDNIHRWRKEVELYSPRRPAPQEYEFGGAPPSYTPTTWEIYAPARPTISHEPPSVPEPQRGPSRSHTRSSRGDRKKRSPQKNAYMQSPPRGNHIQQSPRRDLSIRSSPRGRENQPSRARASPRSSDQNRAKEGQAHQTRGLSHENRANRGRGTAGPRGQQSRSQNNQLKNSRHRGSATTLISKNRFQLIQVDDDSEDDYEDYVTTPEPPPGYTECFLVDLKDPFTESLIPYPTLESKPVAQGLSDNNLLIDTGIERLPGVIESQSWLPAFIEKESDNSHRDTLAAYPALLNSNSTYSSLPVCEHENDAPKTLVSMEKEESLETRVRLPSGKKRAPPPSSKGGGKMKSSVVSQAMENLKSEFLSSQPVRETSITKTKLQGAREETTISSTEVASHAAKKDEIVCSINVNDYKNSTNKMLLDCIKNTMESSRSFRGQIRMEMQIGQIMIRGATESLGPESHAMSWSDLKTKLIQIGRFDTQSGQFTKAVTSTASETVVILDSLGIAPQESCSQRAVWELVCRTNDKQPVRIQVDALHPSSEAKVILDDKILGAVYIHAVEHVHDARLVIAGTSFAQGISTVPGAEEIVKSLFVELPSQVDLGLLDGDVLPSLMARDGELYVDAVHLRSSIRYEIPATAHYVELIRVHDLPIDRPDPSIAENSSVFRARGLEESNLVAAQRLWYEINLGQMNFAKELEENEGLELGGEASWRLNDIIDETKLSTLEMLTRKLLDNMDDVGFGNEGPGVIAEKRIAAAKAKKRAEIEAQKDEFW